MKLTVSERFWAKVRGGDVDTCWLWTDRLIRGYGRFTPYVGGSTGAHRFAYEDTVGPIPDGLDLDHICRERACVNPWHLEPVSRSENLRRGYEARGLVDQCKHGHPFDQSNTFQRSDGGRGCRTCRNHNSRACKARARAAALAALPAQPNTESRTA